MVQDFFPPPIDGAVKSGHSIHRILHSDLYLSEQWIKNFCFKTPILSLKSFFSTLNMLNWTEMWFSRNPKKKYPFDTFTVYILYLLLTVYIVNKSYFVTYPTLVTIVIRHNTSRWLKIIVWLTFTYHKNLKMLNKKINKNKNWQL